MTKIIERYRHHLRKRREEARKRARDDIRRQWARGGRKSENT